MSSVPGSWAAFQPGGNRAVSSGSFFGTNGVAAAAAAAAAVDGGATKAALWVAEAWATAAAGGG